MSMAGKQIVRMGPISILSMVIVLSLATMAVLSFTTARAAQRTADKQAQAISAIYECETAGQQFVAHVDGLLAKQKPGAAPRTVAQQLRTETGAEGDGLLVTKVFESQGRQLQVSLRLEDDLTYTVAAWRMQAHIDSEEATVLWQG